MIPLLKLRWRRIALVLAVLMVGAGGHGLEARSSLNRWDDRGTFLVSMRGQVMGKEQFEIESRGDHIEAKAQIRLQVQRDGKTLEFRTAPSLILDQQLMPITYTWSQKGPQNSSLKMNFESSPVQVVYHTVKGGDDKRAFFLPKDTVILDDNVFHHYQLLVDRYWTTKQSKQVFKVFVPQEAYPGSVTVERRGKEAVEMNGQTRKLLHLVLTTDTEQLDLWVDSRGRVQKIAIPVIQFDVVREK